ncbi:hypothetical protein CMQ_5646 [Grosmannia clavigera kw1407]|uniref:Uncharacterized protein n=1 Tax=Grosmannia clavigera (strain kw1407 / UAMH 11150) TaxID=655863 RepID=F0XTA9_GROCL|nr:uncharacterized protein CMQ_5646 [Grosmannia clavigera kw1407]EFW99225.1 hypothetical protein CMQ_5646 [Grosmannia clavigera kw1407]
MGLHVTPYGTFYVQRSLRTGEVMQVLPVRRPETPSHLPSVDSLGITDNFIERRRASIAATNARASHPQDSLQRELASAGGERLLETGKAVLAQRDDGDVEMNMGNGNGSGSGSGRGNEAGGTFSAPAAPGCDSSSSNSSSHHHRHHHQVNTDPHHPEMVFVPRRQWQRYRTCFRSVPGLKRCRSRSSSTSSHTNSASSMTSQDSASSTSTAVYFPLQDCHPSGSSSVGGANIDVAPAAPAGFRYQQQRHRTDRL